MKRISVLIIILTLLITHLYIYNLGRFDGEWQYKRSIRMYYALKSAYHFGYGDAKAGRREDWDGAD